MDGKENEDGSSVIPEDSGAVVTDESSTRTAEETHYSDAGFDKRKLVSMTIGLYTDDDKSSPLMDVEQSPFKEQPRKEFKPRSADLCEEIVRRWRLYYRGSARFPRPAQWSRPNMLEWLVAHPITSMNAIVYIRGVVTSLSRTLSSELEAARSSRTLETSVAAGSSGRNLDACVAAGSSGQNLEASVTAGSGGRNLETAVTAGSSGRKRRKRSDSMSSSSEGDLDETRKKAHSQKKIAVAVDRLALESRLARLSAERENRHARNSTETLSRRNELCSRRDLLERNIKDLKSSVRTYMMDRLRSQDPDERSLYQSFIEEDNIAIKQAQAELDKIVKKLDAMSDN